MQERRKNVRVRPTADYNIGVELGGGLVRVQLSVIDAAVGGVSLVVVEQLLPYTQGSEIRLAVTLPGFPRFETVASVRYRQAELGGRCGVHFDHLTEEQQTALSRAVAELLERGN